MIGLMAALALAPAANAKRSKAHAKPAHEDLLSAHGLALGPRILERDGNGCRDGVADVGEVDRDEVVALYEDQQFLPSVSIKNIHNYIQ